ncbi:MAG: hypothetical protein IH628_13555, partial [Proteobacteria bacterium]|nr:hypothetical protein [Pseudomonadota bacterium]
MNRDIFLVKDYPRIFDEEADVKYLFVTALISICNLQPIQGQTWTQVADMPGDAREIASSFEILSKAYVAQGLSGSVIGPGIALNDVWQYDPNLDTWTRKSDFPGSARFGTASFTIGDRAYVVGGFEGNFAGGKDLKEVWEYDPHNDQWTRKTDFPGSGRFAPASFSIQGKGYVIGGVSNLLTSPQFLGDVWEYDPSTGNWTQLVDFPGGSLWRASSVVIGQKAFVLFGSTGSAALAAIWEFDSESKSWTKKSDCPGQARVSAIAFPVGTTIMAGTGSTNSGTYLGDFWQYLPET